MFESKMFSERSYIDKFDSMTDSVEIKREYYNAAKEILKHRSGQNGEDLYLYNQKTRKWYKSTSGNEAGTPEYTDEILKGIKESDKNTLVSFHNHPASMPPSADDINSALQNGYAKDIYFAIMEQYMNILREIIILIRRFIIYVLQISKKRDIMNSNHR